MLAHCLKNTTFKLTLDSVYGTKASGAKQTTETINSN